jgi:hypothetical protein
VRIAVAALLLAYAAAVLAVGTRWLPRADWPRWAPRTGIAAWLSGALSVSGGHHGQRRRNQQHLAAHCLVTT